MFEWGGPGGVTYEDSPVRVLPTHSVRLVSGLLRGSRAKVVPSVENHQVVMLISGAWKTYVVSEFCETTAHIFVRWRSLLNYFNTNEMSFTPLQPLACGDSPVAGSKAQPCSPRSMYSLTSAVSPFCELLISSPDVRKDWNIENPRGRL